MKYIKPKKYYRLTKEWLYEFFWYYLLPDVWYLKYRYRKAFGIALDLKNPQKFTEKIQWLKLHDRNPLYHQLVDKFEVKGIVGKLIGEEHIVKTLGIWDTYDKIDVDSLPNQFVLKCTHDSASVTICKNKFEFDKKAHAWKYNDIFMKKDYYHYENKQWAYKGVKPRIIAEEYLQDDKYDSLVDYKFYCFNCKAKILLLAANRFTDLQYSWYDLEGNRLPFSIDNSFRKSEIDLPKNYDKMIALANTIAEYVNSPYVRVDFYEVKGKIYFGEITFYPDGGIMYFNPTKWDYILGSWLKLPIDK